jgi:phage FluMu protein Com
MGIISEGMYLGCMSDKYDTNGFSNWYTVKVCASCHKHLTEGQRMYSSGTCPKCGGSNSGTIVDTTKMVIRSKLIGKWWKFWDIKYIYQGKNKQSHDWLIKEGCKTIPYDAL